ncbi:hypothetical protein V5O48_009785 [Marasmius crinis-equi]|uniref:Uncharacterized protein n=1 Tax=Marasmius crinis-equi TaxID=585013 RepID=A0ABR3FA79_9AGAR
MTPERKRKYELEADLNTRHSKIVVLPRERAETTQLYTEATRLQERVRELEQSNSQRELKVKELEAMIIRLENGNRDLSNTISERKAEIKELKADLDSLFQWEAETIETEKRRCQKAYASMQRARDRVAYLEKAIRTGDIPKIVAEMGAMAPSPSTTGISDFRDLDDEDHDDSHDSSLRTQDGAEIEMLVPSSSDEEPDVISL